MKDENLPAGVRTAEPSPPGARHPHAGQQASGGRGWVLRLGHTEALSESAVLSAPPPGLPPAAAVIGGAGQKRRVCSMAA